MREAWLGSVGVGIHVEGFGMGRPASEGSSAGEVSLDSGRGLQAVRGGRRVKGFRAGDDSLGGSEQRALDRGKVVRRAPWQERTTSMAEGWACGGLQSGGGWLWQRQGGRAEGSEMREAWLGSGGVGIRVEGFGTGRPASQGSSAGEVSLDNGRVGVRMAPGRGMLASVVVE
ncbi:hypothetical protein GUJ93_ZPchr0006g41310 [Zizania palustris]|uniref:Uncharacterized protein n=1 Tax=Zizania palustris TaxID=103762 RepID=A0A8J5VJ12_ZIZPA|nr:hypothetical protein GUJ93_ZPchr0006g41310 [Zizania palustris]